MSILQTIFVQDGNNETMLQSEFSLFTTQIVITEDSNQWVLSVVERVIFIILQQLQMVKNQNINNHYILSRMWKHSLMYQNVAP